MNWVRTMLLFGAAFLGVFSEAAVAFPRPWLGFQMDVLPVLMLYAALRGNLSTVTLLAVLGGLWFDALSANPVGISLLPLFTVGLVLHVHRKLILRDEPVAQFVLGLAVCGATPVLTLLLLWTAGQQPLVGWRSLGQWLEMSLGGAILAPCSFWALDRLTRLFSPRPLHTPSFRPDREIRRGRF